MQPGLSSHNRQHDTVLLNRQPPGDDLNRQPNRQSGDGASTNPSSRKRDAPGPSLALDPQELQGMTLPFVNRPLLSWHAVMLSASVLPHAPHNSSGRPGSQLHLCF